MASAAKGNQFRGLSHLGQIAAVKGKKLQREKLEAQAALRIQKVVRGYLARKVAAQAAVERSKAQELAAVLRLQSVFRGWVARREKEKRRDWEANRQQNEAATVIQSAVRRRLARKELRKLQRQKASADQQASTLAIQRLFRGHQGRKAADSRKQEFVRDLRERSAVRIQSFWRSYLAKKERNRLKRISNENLRQRSSRTIQHAFRRYIAKKGLEIAKHLKFLVGMASIRSADKQKALQKAYQQKMSMLQEAHRNGAYADNSSSHGNVRQQSNSAATFGFPASPAVSAIPDISNPYSEWISRSSIDDQDGSPPDADFRFGDATFDPRPSGSVSKRSRSISPSFLGKKQGGPAAGASGGGASAYMDDPSLLAFGSQELRYAKSRHSPPMGIAKPHAAKPKRSHPYLDSKATTRSRSTSPSRRSILQARLAQQNRLVSSSMDMESKPKKKLSRVESRLYSSVYGGSSEEKQRHSKKPAAPSSLAGPRSKAHGATRGNSNSTLTPGSRIPLNHSYGGGPTVSSSHLSDASLYHPRQPNFSATPTRDAGRDPSALDWRGQVEDLKSHVFESSSRGKKLSEDYEFLKNSLQQRGSHNISSFSIDSLLGPSSLDIARPPVLAAASPLPMSANFGGNLDGAEKVQRDLKMALAKKDMSAKHYEKQLHELESEKNSLQSELSVLRHELKGHMSLVPMQEGQLKEVAVRNKLLETTVKKLQEELSQATDENSHLKRDKMQLEIKVKESKVDSSKDLQDKERELSAKIRQMDILQSRVTQLEKDMKERDGEILTLTKKLEEERKSNHAVLRDTQSLQSVLEDIRSYLAEITEVKRVPYLGLSGEQYSTLAPEISKVLEDTDDKILSILQEMELVLKNRAPGSIGSSRASRVPPRHGVLSESTSPSHNSSSTAASVQNNSSAPLSVPSIHSEQLESRLAEIEKREQLVTEKEMEMRSRRRELEEQLYQVQQQLEDARSSLANKQEELQSIETSKTLIKNLQERLNERERELEDRGRMFERTLKQQQEEFHEKGKELQQISAQISKMVEQQEAIAVREAEAEEKEAELASKEQELKTKEAENQTMQEHLLSVLESQQARDKQAKEEMQKGYQILQQTYGDIAEKEKILLDAKQKLDSQAQQQAQMAASLNKNKEELLRQKQELEKAHRNVDQMVQQKRREIMATDEVIQRKQRDFQQLQQKEQGIVQLLGKLEEREKMFADRDRQFQELAKKRQAEMQQLEEAFNNKRREFSMLQQKIAEKVKEKETLEKAEMNNRISEYKFEERVQKKRKELEDLEHAIRQRRAELTVRQTPMPMPMPAPSGMSLSSPMAMDPMYDPSFGSGMGPSMISPSYSTSMGMSSMPMDPSFTDYSYPSSGFNQYSSFSNQPY
eukprot:ANDGO_00702.mRNA.1 hypothetical protein